MIDKHIKKLKEWKLHLDGKLRCLPYMYWIPKMHKKPSKQRFIAASSRCSTKSLSATITKILKLIDKYHAHEANNIRRNSSTNPYWVVSNSSKVHRMIQKSNQRQDVENIATYDFSTLYTNIPHKKLKARMTSVVSKAFEGTGKKFVSVYSSSARWINSPKQSSLAYT